MNIDNYLNWSYIDAKPVIFYHETHKEWLAFWNGVYMTAEYAYMIAAHINLKYKPTPETQQVVHDHYSKLHYAGVFKEGKDIPYYESAMMITLMIYIGDENIQIVTNGDNIINLFRDFLKDNHATI